MKLRSPSRTDERFCNLMQTAERMRSRAWAGYLDHTRGSEAYHDDEPEAWNRLQERLAAIDQELMHALSSDG
jgi:hypothetical protein